MTETVSTAGRPPAFSDEERRKRILDAAETVFDRKGYGDATMEEIAQAAGMAKKSVYKHFADKPAVFWALINTHDDILKADTSGAVPDNPRAQIRQLLYDLASFVLAPRQLRLTRLIIAEARKNPELAERFHSECMEKALTIFQERLDQAHAVFKTSKSDARTMADMFVGAAIGPLQFRALILPSDHAAILETMNERVELATDLMFSYLNNQANARA